MLRTCSSSRIIDEVIDEIKTLSRDCLSGKSTRMTYENKLLEINKFEQEYLDNCYFGSSSDEEVLNWLGLAKRVIESCLDDKKSEGIELVRVVANLMFFIGKNKDQLVLELESRTPYATIMKELFLIGIQDRVRALSDEKAKIALNIIWSRVYSELREAIEEYAGKRGLLETALKMELLRDEGLMIEQVFIDLLKSEIENVILRIGGIKQTPLPSISATQEILGAVKRIILLYDVVKGLGGEGFEQIENEIAKLRTTTMLFEKISTYDTMGVGNFLDSLANILSQIRGFLRH